MYSLYSVQRHSEPGLTGPRAPGPNTEPFGLVPTFWVKQPHGATVQTRSAVAKRARATEAPE
jgi:hypothetical protein